MIVNGDTSQIDLPRNVKSGLIDATQKLQGIKQIDFVYLSAKDVVRHPVVADIIKAYETSSEETKDLLKPKASDVEADYQPGLIKYPVIGQEH